MECSSIHSSHYDRAKEVKEFDETKTGVKGLLDSGLMKIPRIFIHPPENLPKSKVSRGDREQVQGPALTMGLEVPVIDLGEFDCCKRIGVVDEIRKASEKWGFFHMVNHGIPVSVMEEMINGVRRFHEQAAEAKMEWYSRDSKKKVRYYCNGDLHVSKAAGWRDSFACNYVDGFLHSEELPQVCRGAISKYMECITRLKEMVSELLSEALGLNPNYLASTDCMKTASLVCHYYPFCPDPDLTLGATKHSDPSFLTFLLQDHTGGLQVLHQNQWVDVHPVEGALIANIGDFTQLLTNDKFKSVQHRVLAREVGPRISAACFFYPSTENASRPYGPIQEFVSENNPPLYRPTHHKEYLDYYRLNGLNGTSALPHFKL